MRRAAIVFALGLMMALLHRATANGPLDARASLALGVLLVAAYVGGDLAHRARLPRISGYLLAGFAVGPAWLGLARRDEVDALSFIADATMALIALAAGATLTLDTLRRGRAALARLAPTPAARQAKAATPREKGYLDAVERLYSAGDKPSRDRAYSDRMAELSRQLPDDDEAAAFYALSLLAMIPPDSRNPAVSLKAGGIALAILKKNPQHPGAAHYALHAFDDGEHAARALQAAWTEEPTAPTSAAQARAPV